MFEALENGNKEAVLILTEHGYSAKADHNLVTLKMHGFAKENDKENLNLYYHAGFAGLNGFLNEDGRSILHTVISFCNKNQAVFYDSFDVIESLFSELPINPLIVDRRNQTA